MHLARRVAGPLLGLLAAAALYPGTRALDRIAQPGALGPGFWPRVVLAGFALACLARLAEAWRRQRSGEAAPLAARPLVAWGRLAAGIGLIMLYVLLAPYAGFPLVTAAFMAAFMALGGERAPGIVLGNAAVGTVALLYLFVKVVYLPLPKGDGPFETLTLALYRALRIF
jgi:hypothetical protein